MKILGYEIKKETAAKASTNSVVTVPKPTLETQESIPIQRAFPRQSIGDSGTQGISGIITEEYNPQLQGREGVRVYDEMRKSDGTVRAAVQACTLPIRRAKWFIIPASEDKKDKEISNFVEHALFDWLESDTFSDIIRQALLMLPFGVMPFEKIYGVKEFEGKTYITIKQLAPRMPKSIQQWELPDKTFGIVQIRQDGQTANIPGSKLLIFINEKEGTNWWGTSILRAPYKHWYYKNNFYKIDALAFERQGMGIPKITMPQGYTEGDERKAAQAMQNLRANEAAFLLLPPGYEAEFMNMGSSTTRDPQNSISHHNKEILQSVLAQFLELGQTSSGSRALSSDHSDLFLKAMEAVAETIVATFNKGLITELVDFNFNDVVNYPKLDFAGITKEDAQIIANAYSTLVTSKGIKPIRGDQAYLRALLGLPMPTQEDLEEQEEDEMDMETEDKTVVDKKDNQDMNEEEDDMEMEDDDEMMDKNKKKASEHTCGLNCNHKRKFAIGADFQAWRPLTFAEQKVSWDKIQTTMDEMEAEFEVSAKELLTQAKDSFMEKLAVAIKNGDTNAIKELEVKFVSQYKALLKDTMKRAYEYGKNNVSKEMGVEPPPNSSAALANIELMADTVAWKTATDIETKAKTSAANALKTDISHLQASGDIDSLLDDAVDKAVINTKGLVVNQSLNNGRSDVFQRNSDKIYALQRSEILDQSTCNFCLSMDGRVISMDDEWAKTDSFHSNCRGIWVEILKDEENPPEITGIPDNLGDYYGGQPNDLTQPTRPMTQPGTLVDDFVKKSKKK